MDLSEYHTNKQKKNNMHSVKPVTQKEKYMNTKFDLEQADLKESYKQSLQNRAERGPNDLEERIEYLTNQNELLKKKLKQMIDKYKIMEDEFERLLEENNNLRIVRNNGKVL